MIQEDALSFPYLLVIPLSLNQQKVPVALYDPVDVSDLDKRITEASVQAVPVPQRMDISVKIVDHGSISDATIPNCANVARKVATSGPR